MFDTFEGEEGRQAHLSGDLAARLGAVAADLPAADPDVKFVDIVACK